MNLLERYIEHVKQQQLFQKNDHLLIAVSGGLDSVVLCHLCKAAGCSFSIAHCNFSLRGAESDRDEAFVKTLAADLNATIYVEQFDTNRYAQENKVSIQVAARELRYQWFRNLLKEHGLRYLLTAHHRDDNVETVLMNLAKGTGIDGLKGIQPKQGDLVRPLLFASRQEILQYANENGLKWVEDSSNQETKYARNHFRHAVIPALEKVYPQVSQNIAATIERLNEAAELYQQAIDKHKKSLAEEKGKEVHIPVLKLLKASPLKAILYEIIQQYGFSGSQVEEVIKLLSSESGKYITSATHRVIRNRAWLIIAPLNTGQERLILIESPDSVLNFESGMLDVQLVETGAAISADSNIAFLDAKEIRFPLLLRKWKNGDYFYPLGMQKKKKLSRFFIDQKLSKIAKESVWVVESGKRILWVVGLRIDDRFKITPATKTALKLSFRRRT